jgi:enamine deaminase RidA (YjgF/YER057c/UK114 family)
VLDTPGVSAIVVGARLGQQAHLASNNALEGLVLTPADRSELSDCTLGADIPGDCGDEYRRPPFLTASGDLSHHVQAFPAPYPVVTVADGCTRAFSGTAWERLGGYARAVRNGSRVLVSGTTSTHRDRVVGGSDALAQAVFAFDKIEGSLQSLGASMHDVVRTRIYVRDIADWEAVAREHGRRFRNTLPANTLVQARLVGDDYLVEIEAEAEVGNPVALS